MFEDFITALQNFKLNKDRTFLSLLGIIIGVASVIITTSLGSSWQGSMEKFFSAFTPNVINVIAGRGGGRQHLIEFTESFRADVKRQIPNVKRVFYTNTFNSEVTRKNLTAGNKEIFSIEYGWLDAQKMELVYGSDFSIGDYAEGTRKAIIGETIAKGLFPEGHVVGKIITLYASNDKNKKIPISFEVTGVLKDKATVFGRAKNYVLIPRAVAIWEFGVRNGGIMEIEAYFADTVPDIEKDLEAFARERAGTPDSLYIFSMKTILEEQSKILGMVNLVLSGIAAISLLVGGIGIMNIMLVTVAERRQEIGIRKAIGASNRNILSQFLLESAALTISGAAFGICFGLLICFLLVTKVFPADAEMIFVPSRSGAIISVSVSIFIGIFFGLYPAVQAARLDPVKALEET
ncbi:hypothetical protein DWQ65_12025 [Treponema phagedenis]|uniref:Efflux ABC transporter, permease protein n=1 Tax=Treponema phagedenis TaxID=162 RepID=A0A0B7GX42_TREPH|nr:ABC transporter permease [Treponema phagedenis]QEJ94569.1 FtsX-like permease family protein [Treponema phagedenis]QEJ98683.1 FtsX-like permease family protein [Treponema phagedenis]QEK01552.1 FtsX-like permease family protein [Treponema phagedenis]QEK04189.1 FtsX-like permease family protein [Treponema phagedenis]QEK06639.1 FtsX-like permease family protein [Treponema phagedenis]